MTDRALRIIGQRALQKIDDHEVTGGALVFCERVF